MGPGQHHRAAGHRLADQRLLPAVQHAGLVERLARRQHLVGLDHDADEVVVPVERVSSQVDQRQAGLQRDRQRDVVADDQAPRAMELLAGQEPGAELPQPLDLIGFQPGQPGQGGERILPERLRDRARRQQRRAYQPAAQLAGQPRQPSLGHVAFHG